MRALRPLLPLIGVLVGWLVSVPSVLAQAPKKAGGGHGRAKADPSKALVDQALAALESKDFPTATALLTSAYRSAPRPELLYQLGRVAMAAGRAIEAHDLLRRYLADPAREPDDAATKLAEDLVAAGPPDSGSLSIQSDPGALVWVDDRVVGSLPLSLPVLLSPGSPGTDSTVTAHRGEDESCAWCRADQRASGDSALVRASWRAGRFRSGAQRSGRAGRTQ